MTDPTHDKAGADKAGPAEHVLDTPDLANALESDRFKQFLDQVPVAIAVSELKPDERIVYSNLEFERLTGHASAEVSGKTWSLLHGAAVGADDDRQLGDAITQDQEYIGTFTIARDDASLNVDAWSNVIEDDDGSPVFRLVAVVERSNLHDDAHEELERKLKDKDTLLRELQHRVKNNLQMITALIRLEARNLPNDAVGERFDRLAGRVGALAILYGSLAEEGQEDTIDLGIYVSQIASAVMRAHAVEGIHLDLQVDTWPVSINVAMPTGLAVNELLTNALKHAFVGRDGGTITLHSLVDTSGCRVVVADDGVGLPEGFTWPMPGKLGSLIAQSLRQNAKADIAVETAPDKGVRVTIFFKRANATPDEPT